MECLKYRHKIYIFFTIDTYTISININKLVFILNWSAFGCEDIYLDILISLVIIILSVVLSDCEAWSLTLREERRLRVFIKVS